MAGTVLNIRGVEIHKGYLAPDAQARLVEDLRAVVRAAPFARPVTPGGRRMSVRMTSAGRYGWVTDRSGYRYEPCQADDSPWPAIPQAVLDIWADLVGDRRGPDCCLVNYYDDSAKMGMHQDRDESDFSWPVLSVSLGDSALFRIGNTTRGGQDRINMAGVGGRSGHGWRSAVDLSRDRQDQGWLVHVAAAAAGGST